MWPHLHFPVSSEFTWDVRRGKEVRYEYLCERQIFHLPDSSFEGSARGTGQGPKGGSGGRGLVFRSCAQGRVQGAKGGEEGWAGKWAVWEREPCFFCRLRRTHLWSKAVKFLCPFPSPCSCPCIFSDLLRFTWNLTQRYFLVFLKKFCDMKSSAEIYSAQSMESQKMSKIINNKSEYFFYSKVHMNITRPTK